MPFITYAAGRIHRNLVSQAVASTLDILPTLARLSGAQLPNKPLDGADIWPLLTGEQDEMDRDALLYFDWWNPQCARLGRWKLHVSRYNSYGLGPSPQGGCLNLPLPKPELYDLESDPEESYDVADGNPQVVSAILARIENMIPTFPAEVANAWRTTNSIKVECTPPGALPVAMGR